MSYPCRVIWALSGGGLPQTQQPSGCETSKDQRVSRNESILSAAAAAASAPLTLLNMAS